MTAAIRQAAAAEIGKHRRLLRTGRDGRILSALMLPQLWLATPAGYGVLTTTGRKTGRPRHKCVPVDRIADRLSPIDRRFFRSQASEISAQDVLRPQLVRAQRS